MLESFPREVSRLSPLILCTFGCVCEFYGSAKTCGGPGLPGLPWRALSGAFPRWPDAGPSRPARTLEVAPRARRHPVGAPSAAFPDPASRGTDEWASFFLFFFFIYLLQLLASCRLRWGLRSGWASEQRGRPPGGSAESAP